MIPLRTLPAPGRKPFWTWVFAVLIALVWLVQLAVLAFENRDLATEFGVRPNCSIFPSNCGVESFAIAPTANLQSWMAWANSPFGALVLSPLVSPWLHGDFWHVGFNLLFLVVFGPAVEGEVGRLRFVWLYLAGALAGTACHVAFNIGSTVPTIGASGAIAAILGAHFWRLPRAWVLTYFPPVFLVPVPGAVWGVLWIALQVGGAWQGAHSPEGTSASSVAWMAHLGGFIFGALVGWKSGRKKSRRVVRPRRENVGK